MTGWNTIVRGRKRTDDPALLTDREASCRPHAEKVEPPN